MAKKKLYLGDTDVFSQLRELDHKILMALSGFHAVELEQERNALWKKVLVTQNPYDVLNVLEALQNKAIALLYINENETYNMAMNLILRANKIRWYYNFQKVYWGTSAINDKKDLKKKIQCMKREMRNEIAKIPF